MIPWPYALACVLLVATWCGWLLWRQRLERRALHAQLEHLNAALRQLEVLGVMPDKQPRNVREQRNCFNFPA